MAISTGTKLGPYEILSPLGAGGMGEVYRARDTRLGREVAIKVLPQHLSANPEVRARFEREAKTVSSLNHPNICTLFDVGRDRDTDYLVMELVEGETLAHRLAKGALPTSEVLRIGAQIADALDRAHRAGVVHRDLKPGNVMLTKSGAKLMDFGLARATGLVGSSSGTSMGALTQSPTVAQPLTAEGTIVGTFQYMSPEQLEGQEADARSDMWAMGCVLYEMATGKRAFEGKSQASLISAIISSEPAPVSQVAPLSPPGLDRVVAQCLAKDPADRIQSAHDAKLQLAWIAEGGSERTQPPRARGVRARIPWFVAIALAVAAGVIGRQLTLPREELAQVTRTTIGAPAGTRPQITGDDAGPPAISPDGTMLVFAAVGGGAGKRLWMRRLDEFTARPLAGTDGASYPFWSPDSKSIGFFVFSSLKRLDLEQGSVITLCQGMDGARGGTWSSAGVILMAPAFAGGLYQVPATGGAMQAVTVLDTVQETTHRFPHFLPDGRHFIYLSANHREPDGDTSAICCASLDGGTPTRLFASRSNAVYADGFILFVRDSTLMAQEFEPDLRSLRGSPRATHEVVQLDRSTWNATVSASESGVLVYGLGGRAGNNRLVWFDRTGNRVRNLAAFGNYLSIALAPDGRRLALEWQQRPLADIWTVDVTTGAKSRVTNSADDETQVVWGGDGQHVLYAGRHEGRYRIFQTRADGAGTEQQIREHTEHDVWPLDVSADGKWLLFGVGSAQGTPHGALGIAPFGGGDARMLVPATDDVQSARLSPNGKWLAFDASVSGRRELYVAPLSFSGEGLSARWQVSASGGDRPRWRADGRELYYVRADGYVMAVSLDANASDFRVTQETPLFQAFQRIDTSTIEPSADGQHFAVNVLGGDTAEPLAVVTNWKQTLATR